MQRLEHQTLSFSDFTLDLTRGCLYQAGEEIKLRPKSFEVLKYLVENSGRLVTKEELISTVWPDTSVTDDSLVQCLIDVRRALGERGTQIVKTVPRRGYIFEAEVTRTDLTDRKLVYAEEVEGVSITFEDHVHEIAPSGAANQEAAAPGPSQRRWWSARSVLAASALLAVAIALVAWLIWRSNNKPTSPAIRSLAVLPFKSQTRESTDDYLGLGIANEIITKISPTSAVTVRPTSAIRKYANQEIDALQAARDLKVEAVLDGTYLRVGDQLRITVNLIRVEDGTSLWAEKFDQRFTDIFAIQDQVSQQVAQRLRLKLNPAEQSRLTKRYTSSPEAYSYYAKAMYHFHNIGANISSRSEADLAVDLFKKAIELDPQYALAHAQLGYAYTKIAVFQEDSPALVDQAKQQLAIAERMDPQLAEVHLARYFIVFSQYEGWQVETAFRELRLAQQLDPNTGHAELGDLCFHIGLEEQSMKAYEVALTLDPNNPEIARAYVISFYVTARPEEGLQTSKRLQYSGLDLRYFLEKRMVKEAEPLAEQEYQNDPHSVWKLVDRVLVLALQRRHREAQAAVPSILARERRYRGYHHDAYNIARVYALGGKNEEALKWLRITVTEGFPSYPLFARDPFLDSLREDPAFTQFLTEMKLRWEGYKRNVG
jgi:TolB-like protein/DNA-binding winged helix-turn-helix (wHTH) protein/Flp pilus assembly protein TadD